jgi:hypothetical protein
MLQAAIMQTGMQTGILTTRTLTGSKFDVITQPTFLTQYFNVTHAVRVVNNVNVNILLYGY